jgi:transcriptional regulator with XRE-family HTH domain
VDSFQQTRREQMTKTRDIIIKLKEVRKEKGLSYGDILDLMEKNGDYLAKSTLSKLFSEGSEDLNFKYEETIRPIAKALLGIETIEVDDDMDIQAMKSLLKFKIQRIEELEHQIELIKSQMDKEKIKHHEKLEKEREASRKSIEFLKEQINYKDKRMDLLLQAVQDKDVRYDELLKVILSCPCRKKVEHERT